MVRPVIAILFPTLGPYHVARIKKLSETLEALGFSLIVYRFSKSSLVYSWNPQDISSATLISLLERPCSNILDSLVIAVRLFSGLRKNRISAIFLPSFSPAANFFSFIAAKVAGCKVLLMTESWKNTESTFFPYKLIKYLIIPMFDAALVGGTPHKRYVASYGISESRIFVGYDVVDVDYFARSSEVCKANLCREGLTLPANFFLNLGRFVEKKNLSSLLKAYSLYLNHTTTESSLSGLNGPALRQLYPQPHSLVLVGDGHLKDKLVSEAQSLNLSVRFADRDPQVASYPEVVIYPFQQYNLTPFFFSCCNAFILPSDREEWGLVVNEAQACGVPVLVSSNAGCSEDLVEHGVNGFLFEPSDINALSNYMFQVATTPSLRIKLGSNAQRTSLAWSPSRFAQGALGALSVSLPQYFNDPSHASGIHH